MIKITHAESADADVIEPKHFYKDDPQWRDVLRNAITHWPARTLSIDGKILAIVGLTPIYAKVGEFWAIISPDVAQKPVAFARAVKDLLESYCEAHKLVRVQIVVPRPVKEAFDFALFLGFEPEGILKKYGPLGEDYVMMGRIF